MSSELPNFNPLDGPTDEEIRADVDNDISLLEIGATPDEIVDVRTRLRAGQEAIIEGALSKDAEDGADE